LKNRQNAVVATARFARLLQRGQRGCGLGAQRVEIDTSTSCCASAGAGWCATANRQALATATVTTIRRTSIGKPPGLPLPRTQPYLEFYLNHAKINDEFQRGAFNLR
jgi:hypothetical protein